MLFEELGFRYIGPIDGHNIAQLRKYLTMVKDVAGPGAAARRDRKGARLQAGRRRSRSSSTRPPPFTLRDDGVVAVQEELVAGLHRRRQPGDPSTQMASQSARSPCMTAAMCQGNKLEPVRDAFPDRFFDTGICESHAVAFAAGQAKAGLRPIVDIYSTFLQRSYDQIFQEVALQNLPVTFLLDRAGLTGPDGPTHHGVFDLGYMRLFPNMVVMAPGDEHDLAADARLRAGARRPGVDPLSQGRGRNDRPAAQRRSSWAAPKCIDWGHDGMIIACGTLLANCLKAAALLRDEGLDVGVINARFVKPLDTETLLRAIGTSPFVVTVEEAALAGRLRQRACWKPPPTPGVDAPHVRRLGIPDRFIEHGERGELLADLGLDAAGIAAACRQMAARVDVQDGRSTPRELA